MSQTDPTGSPAFGLWSTVQDLARFATAILAPKLVARQSLDEAFTGRDFGPWAMRLWPPLGDAVVAEFGS
jgi:CubicO group peptidase (beta-lactamase class C family)